MILFESFKPEMEFNNNVKKHLEQYPFLKYSIRETDSDMFVTFSGDLTFQYVKSIISPFSVTMVEEAPLKIKVTGKRNIQDFDSFKDKIIIGTTEKINIPALKIEGLEAKVDTGATTSSLHISYLKIDKKKNIVSFTPLDRRYPQYKKEIITLPIYDTVSVQSSNGDSENRVLIQVDIVIKDKTIKSFLSLTDRRKLEFPCLLGKDLLAQNFVIDVSK